MRILVLGAGGPAGVNLCRALEGYEVWAADQNADHLLWCEPYVACTFHIPEVTVEAVNEVGADLVIPQPDSLVLWAALHAEELEANTYLPDFTTITTCQDKFEAGIAFRRAGLREDRIELVDRHDWLTGFDYPLWLRARYGAGAKAAILARDVDDAYYWLGFWKGRDWAMDFVAEGHLPGRDLAWSSLWYEGKLVWSFTRERLEYLYPNLTPEGLTGTPTIAEIVHDDFVNEVAELAVKAVTETPHGLFSVDLREDEDEVARPTEINAGRGFTTLGLWSTHEPQIMRTLLAGAQANSYLWKRDCIADGLRLSRHIDCEAQFTFVKALA